MISITLKNPLRLLLQHYMNSLHIYSLMCTLRINRAMALKTSRLYERIVHPVLYFKKGSKVTWH